ncbi:MAG TPA: hypothetical protein VFW78_10230 [Bacteroidia bacterium]|nr:hypothetical protein [Bacteroidia bacterium]
MPNHSFNTRFLALTMAFSILVSSFGIAKVTHYCRAASHITKSELCNGNSQNHCCAQNSDSQAESKKASGSCCSKIIKMFRADLETMLNSSFGIPDAFVTIQHDICNPFADTFSSPKPAPVSYQPDIGFLDKVGRDLLFCSFLI